MSYSDLINKAGVSRGAIGPALQEATDAGFLIQRRMGMASSPGSTSQTAMYALRWSEGGKYARHLRDFSGFFVGEGHRTPVPNRFFDDVIRHQPLAVAKVVGTVIRHTVGYQNQFGGRRSSAPLSQRYIAEYSGLSLGKTVSLAIHTAEQAGFIIRSEDGCFSHDPQQQQAVRYAVRWAASSKIPAGERFKNPSSTGSKKTAENRFKNPSTKKTNLKDTCKQQSAVETNCLQKLTRAGLDRQTAIRLVQKRGVEVVENQLDWLEARNPTENRVGMLRKAIDENWDKPEAVAQKERLAKLRKRDQQNSAERFEEEAVIAKAKRHRNERKQCLLNEWESASIADRERWIDEAVKRESSKMLAEILRRESAKADKPHVQVLDVIANERNLPAIAPAKSSDAEVAAGSSNRDSPRHFDKAKATPQRETGQAVG